MKKSKIDFNRGFNDGVFSAKLSHPFHSQWPRNKSGKCNHHRPEYLKGYKEGYQRQFGYLPNCLV